MSQLSSTIVTNYTTLVDVLQQQAHHQPNKQVFTFLQDGEQEAAKLTFAELDQKARAIAAQLQELEIAGQQALLLYPPGLDFIGAFFGCLYAGVVAVPTYPPRQNQKSVRLDKLTNDAETVVVLTHEALSGDYHRAFSQTPALNNLPQITTDTLRLDLADSWAPPTIQAEHLAFLQYTSGSTGTPKGVMVSHQNLIHNSALIYQHFGHSPDSVGVSWLPPYHDMGLIGGIIQTVYSGGQSILMSPVAFLMKPFRWLQTVSRYQAVTSGGPNFAYDLCVEKITPEQRAKLDLSHWRVAATGAEPVRADTIQRFSETFTECGFKASAFYPCYGMAETTLMVSGGGPQSPTIELEIDKAALTQNRVEIREAKSPQTQTVVGCGQNMPDQTLIIVNPKTLTPCPSDQIGEIWVSGKSVAQGYWQRNEETKAVFGAQLTASPQSPPKGRRLNSPSRREEREFLRTGDLGFLHNGELFITGRLKDLIIIRGNNHYPQDIEYTVAQSHPALRPGFGAAFSVDAEGEERLVIVQEVKRNHRRTFNEDEVVIAIRQAVSQTHELQVYAIALLKMGSLPITSSGKVQRQASRQQFLESNLTTLGEWQLATAKVSPKESKVLTPRKNDFTTTMISTWLVAKLSEQLTLSPTEIDVDAPFAQYGLDSKTALTLAGELEEWLGQSRSPTLIYDFPTVNLLAQHLATNDEPAQAKSQPTYQSHKNEAIAIIGLGCRFPGAESPTAFWKLLKNGQDAIRPVPANRPHLQAEFTQHNLPQWGGFLEQIDHFDPFFFEISPHEATEMDPQQRLLLEVSWEALENAGIVPASLKESQTGVFIGISTNDYAQLPSKRTALSGTGNALSIAANRLSYLLNLRGPSWAVDTACSSSLVAVHQAVGSLRSGECNLALAGGVNLILRAELTAAFLEAGMLAPDGRCKTFDAEADGYVRGEGAGVVVLKRLSDAERDGDQILAVIRGSAVNHDGRSNGLTAPNGPAQQEVIHQALSNANLAADQLGYIEAHGTGTSLGDPIEINALKATLSSNQAALIGSVKTNIGHLEAAAGIAGLIKVVLSLKNNQIPPHLNLNTLNPLISFENTNLSIPTGLQSWPNERRLAGISSFGFGGTNAHLIIEAAPDVKPREKPTSLDRPLHLLTLSGKNQGALQTLAQSYARFLEQHPDTALSDICYTANTKRSHFHHRLAVQAETSAQLQAQLQAFSRGKRVSGLMTGRAPKNKSPNIAFLFTGQGSQTINMGRALYETEATFREVIDTCNEILEPHIETPLLDILYAPENEKAEALLHQTRYTQPALFALEYGLAKVWQSWGIEPQIVLGHSLGEYVAACVAGAFTLEEGLRLMAERGRLMQELPQTGQMAAVFATEGQVKQVIQPFLESVSIAAINSPNNVVISGETKAIEAIVTQLKTSGIDTKSLIVSHAFHSTLMEPILSELGKKAEQIDFQPLQLPLISNVTGQVFELGHILDAAYWTQHTRQPVRFTDSLSTALSQKFDLFLEIGPRPILSDLGRFQDQGQATWLSSLNPDSDAWAAMFDSLAYLYVAGADVGWTNIYPKDQHHHLPLPTYPFQRKRYWLSPQTVTTQPSILSQQEPLVMDSQINPWPNIAPETMSRATQILSILQNRAAELLRAEPDEIEVDSSFVELGVGSLAIVEFIRYVEQNFGLRIEAQLFFEELKTLEDLATYLDRELPAEAPLPLAVNGTRQTATPTSIKSNQLYYQIRWEQKPLFTELDKQGLSQTNWLILSDEAGVATKLATELEKHGACCHLISYGPLDQIKLSITWHLADNIPHNIINLWPLDIPSFDDTSYESLATQLDQRLTNTVGVLQHLIENRQRQEARLWFITQGSQPIGSHLSLAVGQAPFWGLGRTCALEHPECWGGLIDLDLTPPNGQTAQQILAAILSESNENQIVFRQGTRYVPRLEQTPPPAQSSVTIQNEASYLITGGLKGVGYEVARWLAQQGAGHLVLLGRTPLTTNDQAQRIQDLKALGTTVEYRAVDVTDLAAMRAFWQSLQDNSIPPIRGIIHCASVWQDEQGQSLVQPLTLLNPAAFSAVMRPKVLGTLSLLQHQSDLDFFLLFSSAASLMGSMGQGSYAAANAFLDGLAHHLQQAGQPALSLNWGAIGEVGFGGTTTGRQVHETWETLGIGRISPSQVLTSIAQLAGSHVAQMGIMAIDWTRLGQVYPTIRDMPWLTKVFDTRNDEQTIHTDHSMADQLASLQVNLTNELSNLSGPETGLERVIQQQLQVMSEQLALLRDSHTTNITDGANPAPPQTMSQSPTIITPNDTNPNIAPAQTPTQGFWSSTTSTAQSVPQPNKIIHKPTETLEFSLFYFGNYPADFQAEKYDLLFEGARFADEHDFTAVWVPERHFHAFGGFSPNPSLIAAALARETRHVQLRAGSVVLPIHHPVRVAEEWALVDNLSQGRVGLSFASGWHPNDFVFAPEAFGNHRAQMFEQITTVQKLWQGEAVPLRDGGGQTIEVKISPLPKQPTLPTWLTIVKNPHTFIKAGEIGAGVLTNLMGQSIEDLAHNIQLYHSALVEHNHSLETAQVTVLLHTFLGDDLDAVRAQARQPFLDYLKTSVGLFKNLVQSLGMPIELEQLTEAEQNYILSMAYDRYVQTSALIGTPNSCAEIVTQLKEIGVTEIACFVDFGLDKEDVLEGLTYIKALK